MQASIGRSVAREYERRRFAAEQARDRETEKIYCQWPKLRQLDQKVAAAGADLLLEAIDPGRPRLAAGLKAELLKRRCEFLEAADIKPDFDQVHYSCPICKDTGYKDNRRCTCYRNVLIPLLTESANLKTLDGFAFDQFDESLFADQPDPGRYHSELSPRQQIQGLRQACLRFVSEFDQPETRNLLFVGKPGTGKTFLMVCIAHALLEQGYSVLYLTAPQLFDIIQEYRTLLASFKPDDIRLEKAMAMHESLMNCELLLIDDLGTEAGAASRYADLLTVIDGRNLPNLKTIISSNSDPATLRDTYDERLLSRLVGGFAVYRFFGEDIRMTQNRRRRRAASI